MLATSLAWTHQDGWNSTPAANQPANLVFYFGSREVLADGARYAELRAMFPGASLMGCTTGGQIHGDELDDELSALAIRFDATQIKATSSK